jgi:aminoglycoside phosphotransferase family enzyme/predicted kinase
VARSELPEHVRALLRRGAYPHVVAGKVELVQTHISYVLLAGDHVYKLKKAVDFGFADFSSLAKRRRDCEAEVRLNQRGCAGIYLGVEPVTRRDGGYRVGGRGEVIDYAVHMRRLPANGMMDALLARDAVSLEMIGRLAARLVDFHRAAGTSSEVTRTGGLETLRANWQDNFALMRRFAGRTLSAGRLGGRVQRYAEAFLAREEALLRRREEQGWVRDCHGDLRSDAVCFDPARPDEICVFDCIEFNDRLRFSDTALDVAFLAMDLDFRGRPELSDLFIGLYAAAIGDRELPLLLGFYKCYRACVRGKVESLLLDDPSVSLRQKAGARRRAKAYFRLAEAYARRPVWRDVLLVMGLTGSGKSVLAGALASRLGAVLLTTDLLRREVFQAETATGRAAVDAGIYAPAERERIYDDLSDAAAAVLAQGRGVVLDGTYIEARQRAPLLALAQQTDRRLLVVECQAPDDVIKQRQAMRQEQRWTTSQGRWDVYLAQKARYEEPVELAPEQRLTVETTRPLSEQMDAVLERAGQK